MTLARLYNVRIIAKAHDGITEKYSDPAFFLKPKSLWCAVTPPVLYSKKPYLRVFFSSLFPLSAWVGGAKPLAKGQDFFVGSSLQKNRKILKKKLNFF